ncbi:hypothetical protein MGG_17109 [Pyricularia oryzae 70-15]|uniref:Uncharacterized protein n=3 Tax=Pyricularia oryzae TaxID=318829 RepID=G4N8Y1_PYRO7|nr:uncharacterized protein MGG_17109 [Pyricularia oryzae 70-15]EHA50275.1 hypothetical protein MGG_17109 [Pyricularia oryzae 70-15]ELQ35105.1 hypothetical protein OOU_Y34scaffold00726g65 [Pyricularia oryzae Y34]KAI7916966.1 hypothetical protein M0657_008332 [Pyricularia oryzae]KAI7928862.1 hypothetical protein M9X92_001656 [Pyricularia oryzae]
MLPGVIAHLEMAKVVLRRTRREPETVSIHGCFALPIPVRATTIPLCVILRESDFLSTPSGLLSSRLLDASLQGSFHVQAF